MAADPEEQQDNKDAILHYVVKKFQPDAHVSGARPVVPNRDHFQIELAKAFDVKKSALRKHVDMKDIQKTLKAFKEQSPAFFLELEEAIGRQ